MCCWRGISSGWYRCCFLKRCTAVFFEAPKGRRWEITGRETKRVSRPSPVSTGWTPFCFSSVSLQSSVHCPERDSQQMLQRLVGAFLAFPEFPRSFPDPLRGSSGALRGALGRRSGAVGGLQGRLSWRSLRGLSEVSRTPLTASCRALRCPPLNKGRQRNRPDWEARTGAQLEIIKCSLHPTLRIGFCLREDRCLM